MNTTAVVQAVNDFPWGLVLLVVIVVAAAYVWEKGLLGTATEARIKAFIAKAKHDVGTWEAKLAAKQAQGVPPAAPAPAKDKATRIAENAALLSAGTITQAEFDAAKATILAE